MEGFEVFMESLKREISLRSRQKSGVDLVLSCVDNYEARMVVNQVGCLFFDIGFPYSFKKPCENQLLFIFNSKFSTAILIREFFLLFRHAMNWDRHGWNQVNYLLLSLGSKF